MRQSHELHLIEIPICCPGFTPLLFCRNTSNSPKYVKGAITSPLSPSSRLSPLLSSLINFQFSSSPQIPHECVLKYQHLPQNTAHRQGHRPQRGEMCMHWAQAFLGSRTTGTPYRSLDLCFRVCFFSQTMPSGVLDLWPPKLSMILFHMH